MDQDENFETHDIYLAAYLKISGCNYVKRYRQGPRVFFVFSNPGGSMKDLREAFYANKGTVPAKKFSDEVVSFKQLCFGDTGP